MTDTAVTTPDPDDLEQFWELARNRLRLNPVPGYLGTWSNEVLVPPAWSFGATEAQADELLDLVLDGTKTATASALADYESVDEQPPRVGDLSIVLDGRGHPRALIETTEVAVVPFDQVDADHAHAEGEGDRTLDTWRADHERFFTEHAADGYSPDMPVVLERFTLRFP